MSSGFVLLFGASCALLAFAASAVTGLALPALGRVMRDVDARGRARLWLALAFAPALSAALVPFAAFGPWLGLAHDHCLDQVHGHAHLCFAHPAVSASPLLGLPAAALGALVVTRAGRTLTVVARSWRVGRALTAVVTERIGDAWVVPVSVPQAFVIGFLRPRLFVTRGLLERSEGLEAIVAHERSHVRRRDPLRRLLAGAALGFHLPGIAGALERRLGVAHEMAADEDAAGELGSAICVAESLVGVAQAQVGVPDGFAPGVSVRVRELLSDRARNRGLPVHVLYAGATTALVGAGLGATAVHHVLEHLLELLGA
jgi:Zn-dependent protease with chaperone function